MWRQRLGPADRLRTWIPGALVLLAAPDGALRGTGFSGSRARRARLRAKLEAKEISAYTLRHLASDVVAVIDHMGDGPAVLFGHDWGAPIVWHTALLHPDRIRCGSRSERAVPSARTGALHRTGPIHLQGAFFYQIYFQQEGVAEAELEADTASALRKLYSRCPGGAT
jgi:pimeloyl-ACP methyl ester carboxylesterase